LDNKKYPASDGGIFFFFRTFDLWSKVLSLEKAQIYLAFSSLIRTFAASNSIFVK